MVAALQRTETALPYIAKQLTDSFQNPVLVDTRLVLVGK
jgi:hypothetical protein